MDRPGYGRLKTVRDAIQPVVKVELVPEGTRCDASQCLRDAQLKITFIGQPAQPTFRCLADWPTARSVLLDTGYKTDYTPEAADTIMRYMGCPS